MRSGKSEPNDGSAEAGEASAARPVLASPEEILESISDGFYAVDDDWRFTYVNRVAEGWWKRSRTELIGKHYWTEFPQAVGTAPYEAHFKAARERQVVRLEAVSPVVGHWVDISIFPSPHGLSVYFRDISERKRAEARQRLLVNELNHRVKNALATVQAIAAQSLKHSDLALEVRERFTDRLIALSRANQLLVAETWRGASLRDVAAQVASPHADPDEPARFAIEGPDIFLSARSTTSMALALHELATNAAKYGALSAPDGRVSLAWSITGEGAEARFRLTWIESGGPPVTAPSQTGFGSRLLQEGVRFEMGAEVRIDYAPSGLVCTIEAPLGRMTG